MIRNTSFEMRACSLPPLSEIPIIECSSNKSNNGLLFRNHFPKEELITPSSMTADSQLLYKQHLSEDLGLSEEIFQGCSETESGEIHNSQIRYSKHSPSDCSSAFTDEDSGCQLHCCSVAPLNSHRQGIPRTCSVSAIENRSMLEFGNKDEFLAAMTEDLADWLSRLYPELGGDLISENFFDRISDGVLLCHHANEMHKLLAFDYSTQVPNSENRLHSVRIGGIKPTLPSAPPLYQMRVLSPQTHGGGSFWSRDNVANFIYWCRAMRLPDSILFETEDLVSKKNLRSVIVCLLELARLGGHLGIEVPEIIYLEKDIDAELAAEAAKNLNSDFKIVDHESEGSPKTCDFWQTRRKSVYVDEESSTMDLDSDSVLTADSSQLVTTTSYLKNKKIYKSMEKQTSVDNTISLPSKLFSTFNRYTSTMTPILKETESSSDKQNKQSVLSAKSTQEEKPVKPRLNRPIVDMRSLDEIVRDTLSLCTCEQTFPMIRLSEGRYLFGDKSTQIFVRILRNHVMVRVGGGWDTLNHFLQKYDECRKVQNAVNNPVKYRNDFSNYQSFASKCNNNHHTDNKSLSTTKNTIKTEQQVIRNSADGLTEDKLQVTKKGRQIIRPNPQSSVHSETHCSISNKRFDWNSTGVSKSLDLPDVKFDLYKPPTTNIVDNRKIKKNSLGSEPAIEQNENLFHESTNANKVTSPGQYMRYSKWGSTPSKASRKHEKLLKRNLNRTIGPKLSLSTTSLNNESSIVSEKIQDTVNTNQHNIKNFPKKLTCSESQLHLLGNPRLNKSKPINIYNRTPVNKQAKSLMHHSSIKSDAKIPTDSINTHKTTYASATNLLTRDSNRNLCFSEKQPIKNQIIDHKSESDNDVDTSKNKMSQNNQRGASASNLKKQILSANTNSPKKQYQIDSSNYIPVSDKKYANKKENVFKSPYRSLSTSKLEKEMQIHAGSKCDNTQFLNNRRKSSAPINRNAINNGWKVSASNLPTSEKKLNSKHSGITETTNNVRITQKLAQTEKSSVLPKFSELENFSRTSIARTDVPGTKIPKPSVNQTMFANLHHLNNT